MIWAFNLKSHLMLCLLDKCSWWMSTTSNVWYVPTSRSLNSLHNMEIVSPKLHVSPLEIIPLQSSSFFNQQRGSFWAFRSFCSSKSEREIHTRDVWSSPFVALRSTFTSCRERDSWLSVFKCFYTWEFTYTIRPPGRRRRRANHLS